MERASGREFQRHRRKTSRRWEAGAVKIAIVVFAIAMFCLMALVTLKSNRTTAYRDPAQVGAWQF